MSRENIFAAVTIEAGIQNGPAIPLDPSQADELAMVLSRAYYEEPQFRYLMPDERTRLSLLPGLFRVAIRASQLYGQIYTTQSVDGGALWIGPGDVLTAERMMRTGFPTIPIAWERTSVERCISLGLYLDEVHERLIRGRHWYLLALGVEPSKQKAKISGTLIEPLLSRADSDGLPCYLETFNERNLPF